MSSQATHTTKYQRRQILGVGSELKVVDKYLAHAEEGAKEIHDDGLVEDLRLFRAEFQRLLDAFIAEHQIR